MVSWVKSNFSIKFPGVLALLFLVILVLVFFYPVFLGLVPLPSDLIVGGYYPWLDYRWGGYITNVPIKNSLITDAVSLTFPLKYLMAEIINKGEMPLWNHLMFGGYPLLASMPLGFFFPTTVFYLLFDVLTAWSLQIMFQVMMGTFGMYLFARQLRLSVLSSLFSAIAFGFGGFMLIWLEWNSQSMTAAILPLLFFGVGKYLDESKIFWGLIISFAVCLAIFAGFLQITFFSFVALAFFCLFMVWGEVSRWNLLGKLFGFGVIGILLSSVFLFPAFELVYNSQRFFEVVSDWEKFLPIEFLLTILIPDFFGNQTTANFWAVHNYTNVGMYAGTITAILSGIGAVVYWNRREVRFFGVLFLVVLLIAIRNPIGELIYKLGIWGGDSMTMNRSLFLINFSLAVLGGFGIEGLKEKNKIGVYRLGGLFVLGLMLVIVGIVYLLKGNLMTEAHAIVTLRNLVIPSGVVVLSAGLFFIFQRIKFNYKALQIFLILLLVGELFRFGWKFNTFGKREFVFPQTKLTEFLKQLPESRLVTQLDVLPPNMWVPFGLETIGGYDSVYPLSTAKVIAAVNSGSVDTKPQTKHGVIERVDSPLLSIIGTRYYLTVKRNKDGGIDEKGVVDPLFQQSNFKQVFEDKSIVVLENLESLDKFYWANQVFYMDDTLGLRELIKSKDLLKEKRVFNNEFFFQPGESNLVSPASLSLNNSDIMVATNNSKAGYLVYSETFYPGWKVFVDGKERKIYRTNFGFMGVFVPGGSKFVEFRYMPYSLWIGAIISSLTLLSMIAVLGIRYYLERIKLFKHA